MNNRSRRILGQGPQWAARAIGWASLLLVLTVWAFLSASGTVASRFLPSPWKVAAAAFDIEPNILVQGLSTAGLVVLGLPIGAASGILIGILVRRSFLLRSVLSPIIESWRPVPPAAVIPFFIIWFGFAWYGKVLLVALGCFLVVVVGVVDAIDHLDPIHLRVALSFGARDSQLIDTVVLPGIVPALLSPLRIALAVALTTAIVAEFMGATAGLGHVLNVALNTFATHTVILCAIMVGLIGTALDSLIRALHSRATVWARSATEALDSSQP